MTSSIYAPEYLRLQNDTQLHLIADMIEDLITNKTELVSAVSQMKAALAWISESEWFLGESSGPTEDAELAHQTLADLAPLFQRLGV